LAQWIKSVHPSLSEAHGVLWALARSRGSGAQSAVEKLLRHGTPSVRAVCIRILTRERGEGFLPELRRCLHEGTPGKVAREAFWSMHRLGAAAEDTALEMLVSEDWTERKAALCLLRHWGKLSPAQKKHAGTDPHPAVRHAARWHPDSVQATGFHPKWGRKASRSV
jgi:hypothetical protein